MDQNNKIKILIIEDDQFLLNMYATKFELENFEVYCADNGESGFKAASQVMPDVVLLDVLMPVMNGFEVLEKLKADAKMKAIPVIMLTNLNQTDEVNKGLSLGAADFLIKAHFMPSEVVEKIKAVLAKRR